LTFEAQLGILRGLLINIFKINNTIVLKDSTTLYEYSSQLEETLNVFFVEKYSKRAYERASWPKNFMSLTLELQMFFLSLKI